MGGARVGEMMGVRVAEWVMGWVRVEEMMGVRVGDIGDGRSKAAWEMEGARVGEMMGV